VNRSSGGVGSQSDKNGADSSPQQEQFSRSKMGYQAAARLFILVLARTTATGFAQAFGHALEDTYSGTFLPSPDLPK
jgi:hypothetical protein